MKKWILLLLCLSLLVCMAGCGEKEPENIVEDLEGPEGIELFAGLWYCEHRDLWVEIYYDGTWCSFEDGGLLRAYGSVTIAESVAVLEPKEGEESWKRSLNLQQKQRHPHRNWSGIGLSFTITT